LRLRSASIGKGIEEEKSGKAWVCNARSPVRMANVQGKEDFVKRMEAVGWCMGAPSANIGIIVWPKFSRTKRIRWKKPGPKKGIETVAAGRTRQSGVTHV
jgi:hypothetical protein